MFGRGVLTYKDNQRSFPWGSYLRRGEREKTVRTDGRHQLARASKDPSLSFKRFQTVPVTPVTFSF